VTTAFVIGYDPGGNDAHGVAVLQVREKNARWNPISLEVKSMHSLRDAVTWLSEACRHGRVVSVGIDTLTEWNSGAGGWRPADLWLRKAYPTVAKSVVSPNAIYGSMAVNGAAFLALLAPRFLSDGTMVTEAHPKVCLFALTGKKQVWARDQSAMVAWLIKELGVDAPTSTFGRKDDCFDAGIALLAALRGLNGDWNLDLHAEPNDATDGRVRFFGQTHYWWPPATSARGDNDGLPGVLVHLCRLLRPAR
jgi:Protein of unknown function (DUF429)